jgi:hypothetical protein
LEANNGRLRLVLRSKKVLSRVADYDSNSVVSNSLLAWNGQVSGTRRRVMVYEYVLDERQARALREARELSEKTGLILEVTDLSRQNALKRLLTSGLSAMSGQLRPRLDSRSSFASENCDSIRPAACPP